jgi:hypothetical protein
MKEDGENQIHDNGAVGLGLGRSRRPCNGDLEKIKNLVSQQHSALQSHSATDSSRIKTKRGL